MAARAIASGTISFGLVAIPIKVYAASKTQRLRFSMLHEGDNARLKQHYRCTKCDETVERSDTVKGYEYSRGQYVVLTEDELKALEKKRDRYETIFPFGVLIISASCTSSYLNIRQSAFCTQPP